MKNKKYYIFIGLTLALLIMSHATFAATKITKHKASKVIVKKESVHIVTEDIVTLEVLGNKYTTEVKKGSTVYDAMLAIQDTRKNNFSFVSKNYSSLGNFIDEINGVKGTPGKYWFYYVNDKKASLGVSKYILKSGDKVSWKQESL